MVSSASIRNHTRTSVAGWALLALLLSPNPPRSLAQDGQDWVGKRVITKFGAVLKVGKPVVVDERLENAAPGGLRGLCRIYCVQLVNGRWLWLQDEKSGNAGWATAEWIIPYDQAADYFTSEIRANPNNTGAYRHRAEIWRHEKEFDKAIADSGEDIRLASDDALSSSAAARPRAHGL